jgi:hypothetical protein
MKDWQASVRTWESNSVSQPKSNNKINNQINAWQGARDIIKKQQLNK